MDALNCMYTRRSIRNYSDKKINLDQITKILEAGTKAPSAGNLQDFRFIIVNDKNKIKALADHCNEQHWIATAPMVVVVCSDTEKTELHYGLRGQRLYSTQNAAAAVQNVLLAAHALGLGTCWIGAFNEEFVSDQFGIPEKVRPQAIITIGYAEGKPDPKHEDDLDTMIFFNSYGSKIENMNLVLKEYSKEIEKVMDSGDQELNKGFSKVKKKMKKLMDTLKNQIENRK